MGAALVDLYHMVILTKMVVKSHGMPYLNKNGG